MGNEEGEKKRQQAEPRINKHLFVRFFENKFLLYNVSVCASASASECECE